MVVTIIGILVGMLLPAVNSAREAGRSAQCKNNLKQLGMACLAHEEAQGIFPTGGWGWDWVGDPDRGYGTQQPGGWIYNTLPDTEMNALHDLGRGGSQSVKQQAILQMVSTPLPFTNCPTRRRAALFTLFWGSVASNSGGVGAPANFQVARSDYAINCGDLRTTPSSDGNQYGGGPPIGSDGAPSQSLALQAAYFGTRATSNLQWFHGISFEQSTIRKDDIADGLSQTLLLGEKYLGANLYGCGLDGADNENEYVGFDDDIGRTTCEAPMRDRWGYADWYPFGSAHPNAANFVLCDGALISVNYSVNAEVFRRLGTRAEGLPVDMSQL